MNRTTRLSILAVAMLLMAAPASAATRWGASVFGSWNTHTMGDWNDQIDQLNQGGADYNNIENGFGFGVGPTVTVNDNWSFGAHYERVMPSKTSDDANQDELNTASNVFGASAGYWFPSTSQMRFGINGSADWYQLASTASDPGGEVKIEGSGIGFMFRGVGSYAFSPMFSGDFSAGYRIADVDVETIDGQEVSDLTQDYSGFSLRAGLSMNFGQ